MEVVNDSGVRDAAVYRGAASRDHLAAVVCVGMGCGAANKKSNSYSKSIRSTHSLIIDFARTRNAGGASTVSRPVNIGSRTAPSGGALWAAVLEETKKLAGPTRGRDRTKIAELLANEPPGVRPFPAAVLIYLAWSP